MFLNIVTIDSENNSVLYQKTEDVSFPLNMALIDEIETMRAFYKKLEDKAGFAAPQVGLSKSIILIEQSLFDGNPSDEPVILMNPKWTPLSSKVSLDYEGCLSVPGKVGFVERYLDVQLKAWQYHPENQSLTEISRDYHNEFSSVLWQHEIDHLEGKVYVDKAKLVLTVEIFQTIQYYLIQQGKWTENTSLFDGGALVYPIAQAYQQEKKLSITDFLDKWH